MTTPDSASVFDTDDLHWTRYAADPRFDYPIGYETALLGHQEETGRLDLLIRWHPNAYCHFHRHLGATTTVVLEGEHHVIDIDEEGNEVAHDVRPAGTYRTGPGGDVHMERGGPEGSLVLFVMHEPTGRLFEILDDDRNVLAVTTIDSMVEASRQATPEP